MTPLRHAQDPRLFGGKAAWLARLLVEELPVPDGVALSVAATTALAAGGETRKVVEEQLSGWLQAQLHATSGEARFAVRSSAVGEDGHAASFAGQHRTVLGAHDVASVIEAALEVHRSATSSSALAYRERRSVQGAPAMAVVVQRLIHPVCAGVLFTADPVTGADEIVVEASWGLGEAVVAGLVIPDRLRFARTGTPLEVTAGQKDLRLVADASGGTREEPVPDEDVERLCLPEGAWAQLLALAARCRALEAGPIDVEWALDEERLWLLQCRPATAKARVTR